MKLKGKDLFIGAAALLFLIPGIGALYSGMNRAADKYGNSQNKNRNVAFDKEYPFAGEGTDQNKATGSNLLSSYTAVTNKVTGDIENYSGKYNVAAPFFLDIYGKITKALGKDLTEDAERAVIRLNNGYLTYSYLNMQDTVKYEDIGKFNEWLKEKDIPFLSVIPADKSDDRYAVYPKGYPVENSETGNRYAGYLKENGISYVESGEVLLSENQDFFSWFFKTDHHWNVRAGFCVARAIAERLNTEFGLPTERDILNRDMFRIATYEDIFLGSQGKKATRGYISPEDFEVYYPLFDTEFSIEIPTMTMKRTGSFENTLVDSEALKVSSNYTDNAYNVFLYGDVPLARIHNRNCQNGTRVLMLKTSEANVVDTYLSFSVEYLDIIDPRLFNGSIRSFIETSHPDAVLMCAYPSEVLNSMMRDIP